MCRLLRRFSRQPPQPPQPPRELARPPKPPRDTTELRVWILDVVTGVVIAREPTW